jgi:hypothetical protein
MHGDKNSGSGAVDPEFLGCGLRDAGQMPPQPLGQGVSPVPIPVVPREEQGLRFCGDELRTPKWPAGTE